MGGSAVKSGPWKSIFICEFGICIKILITPNYQYFLKPFWNSSFAKEIVCRKKRHLYDLSVDLLLVHFQLKTCSWFGEFRWHIRHRNVLFEARWWTSACHVTCEIKKVKNGRVRTLFWTKNSRTLKGLSWTHFPSFKDSIKGKKRTSSLSFLVLPQHE